MAFLVDGKMCINVVNDEIMCRVDPGLHEALVEKPGCRSMIMKGKELKGWVLVEEMAIRFQKNLQYWLFLCLAFNKEAKASKRRKA